MDKLKMFDLKTDYSEYSNCFMEVERYSSGNGLAVFVNSEFEGPICDLSTNIVGDYGSVWTSDMLSKNAFFVKAYDGMPAIAKDLEEKGLIKSLGIETYQGYGKYSAFAIEPKAIRYMEPNDVKNELIKYFKEDKDFLEKAKENNLDNKKLDDYFSGKLEDEEAKKLDEIFKIEDENDADEVENIDDFE